MKNNKLLTFEDCKRTMYDNAPNGTNEGEWAIIKPKWFKPNFRTRENQLFKLECGFGCNPDANGNACYGHFIDGEETRIERYDLIGIANDDILKEFNLNKE